MFPSFLHNRSGQAYTLLQMMVAMGIVIVLAALSLPLLRHARERAAVAQCLGNLRQFGGALALRIAEQGDLPPYKAWRRLPDGSSVGDELWRAYLVDYLPIREPLETCLAAEGRYVRRSEKGYGNIDFANYGWSQAMNGVVGSFQRAASVPEPHRLFIMSDSMASQKLYKDYQDAGRRGGGSWSIRPRQMATDGAFGNTDAIHTMAFRHNGRAHLLFMDGRVEARRRDEIPYYRPQSPEGRPFWNYQ